MRMAIAACAAYPDLSRSNACLRDSLEAQGVRVEVLLWNQDPIPRFLDQDLVLLRQTWDYQDDPGGFAAWMVRAEALGGRMSAPSALTVWNNDKRTLSDLSAIGIEVPETVRVTLGSDPSLSGPLGTDKIVLKPVFGGSGVGVQLCDNASLLGETLQTVTQAAPGRPVMAQSFLPEIADGEWKITCIDGEAVLAVHAVPKAGEFRINSRFGPTIRLAAPPADAVAAAGKIMAWLGTPLCGRVDGVMRNERFICTELELTDPDLHLHYDPSVAERLAQSAIRRAKAG